MFRRIKETLLAFRSRRDDRAYVLATAACDSIWGGEHVWESCTDKQFEALKSALYKRRREIQVLKEENAQLCKELDKCRYPWIPWNRNTF